MGVAVSFSYLQWIMRYPEFAASGSYPGVLEPAANDYFGEAGLYHDNSGIGGPTDPAQQLRLMNMVTAHLAQLYSGSQLQPAMAPTLVGRISQASEGSVSASVEFPNLEERAAFWAQTRYGLSYWQATRNYRTGRFIAPLHRTLPRPF